MPTFEEAMARPRGRRVPALPLHEFKDSGYSCRLHKISPMTLQRLLEAIRKEAKKKAPGEEGAYPTPPIELISIGGDVPSPEPITEDEDYQKRLLTWQTWAMNEANERLLRIAAVDACVFPPDEFDQAAIDRFKARMAQEGATIALPESYDEDAVDRIVWLFHFCFGSPEDMTEFYNALTTRAAPAPEAVEAEIATFSAAE